MDVRALGHVEAGNGARTYALGGPTQRSVFAALVARRGEVVDVSALVEVCWPTASPPDRADHNIRTYVHRLRNALQDDGERLETIGTGYRLRLDPGELDLERFEELAGIARRGVSTGDTVAALDALDAANALWTGRPYGEFADEPWAIAEVARLTEAHAALDESRAEALLAVGRAADAVVLMERVVRDEPLRERPRALLMRSLYESGRQAEALRAFQDFRRYMIDEAGIDPSPSLVALDREIASGQLASPDAGPVVGNYELHERIGEGAFAVVHRSTQASLDREVAVKIVRAELANRPEFIRRFEAEAQMVARIEHPHVVPLYDYWREPDRAYLVMRFMSGGSLETRLDAGPWSVEATATLVDQIASALDAAHEAGVVHRDVKPANIMFDDADRAFLGDFGIALTADERARPEAALSEGSPIFASPEQLRREPVGPEADVHALGIVAYTLLAGRTPFADSPDEPTLLRRQMHDSIPSTRDRRPELPAALDDVLATATAKQPSERYPTASAFAEAFRAAGTSTPSSVSAPRAMRPRSNPYKGLRAFDETDAADFHGRERLVDELVDRLTRPDSRMLAVLGPSGSGKSSVVRAGLLPALRAGRVHGSTTWFTTTMIPGPRPFEALETALLRVAVNPPAALLDQLRDGDRGILRAVKRIVPDDNGVVAIVIDQFEELFTAGGQDADRDQFLRALTVAATESSSPVRILLTLRADFYDRPLRHPEFAPLLKQHTVVVTPLAPDELEHAIVTPAATVGVDFEPGLVAEIVADVNHEPGALPLLQYALTQVFDATDGDTITVDSYRAIGGLTGALGRRAEELYRSATDDERSAARRLFGRLVALGEGTEDTRRRVRVSELGHEANTEAVLDRFGRARLLTFDHDPASREPTLEIAHEALIREWPRLRRWLDEDRDGLRIHRHLTDTAAAWIASGRDDGELYRGARLDAAVAWSYEAGADLNDAEREFVAASVAAHDAEEDAERARFQQQVAANRRLRTMVAVVTAIAVLAAAVGIFALEQSNRADDQTAEALTQASAADEARVEAEAARGVALDASAEAAVERERAESNAAEAQQQADAARAAEGQADLERIRAVSLATAAQDPSTAVLLAVEAYRLDPSIESLDALHRVLTEIPGYHGGIGGTPYAGMVSIDDTTVAAATGVSVDIWDVTSRELVRSIPHAGHGGLAIMTLVGRNRLAVADAGRTSTTIYEIQSGAVVQTIEHGTAVDDIAASDDGTRLAAGLIGGDVEVWTLGSETPAEIIDTGDVDVSFVRWHADGRRLAVVLGNAVVQLWELGAETPTWETEPPQAGIVNQLNPFAAEFDPEGGRFAFVAGSLGPSLRVIDVATGLAAREAVPLPTLRNFTLDDLEWRDGDTVVVPSRGSVVAVDLATGSVAPEVDQYISAGFAVWFSDALDQYVVAGLSGLEFWSTDASGPLERIVPLTPEQSAGLEAGGGPILAALSGDGSRLITSVFKIPQPIPPTTVTDLSADGQTTTVAEDLGVVIGFGDFTMNARSDFTIELLDDRLDPIGPPVPLPFDYSELGVSDDGRFLALGRQGGLADVHRVSDGALIETVSLGDAGEFAGAQVGPWFTSDGDFMSLTTTDGRSGIWRTEPLERLDVPDGLSDRIVYALGDWLFAQEGALLQRWDPATLEPVGVPIPLAGLGGLGYPRFDRSHLRIVADGTEVAKVFDLETGRQLGRDLPYNGGSTRVQFTADGSLLAVPAGDAISLWNFDTDSWADLACRFAGRNMAADEWDQLGPRTIEYRATCEDYPIDD